MLAAAYSTFGLAHAASGIVALLVGGWILLDWKGTVRHVRLGWVYVASMFWLDGSSFAIYHLTGRFNLFHILAVLSLAMVVGGVGQVIFCRRIRRWMWRHYQYMCWSYVGLLTATANEACVRVGFLTALSMRMRGALPLIASAAIVGGGAVLIFRKQGRILAQVG